MIILRLNCEVQSVAKRGIDKKNKQQVCLCVCSSAEWKNGTTWVRLQDSIVWKQQNILKRQA